MVCCGNTFPSCCDWTTWTPKALQAAVLVLNNRPRKRLGLDSPLLAYQRETRKGIQADLWHTRETKRRVLR